MRYQTPKEAHDLLVTCAGSFSVLIGVNRFATLWIIDGELDAIVEDRCYPVTGDPVEV